MGNIYSTKWNAERNRYQRLAEERQREIEALQEQLEAMQTEKARMEAEITRMHDETTELQAEITRMRPPLSRRQQWVRALRELSRGREGLALNIPSRAMLAANENTLTKCHELILTLSSYVRSMQLGVRFLTSRTTMRDFDTPDQALGHYIDQSDAEVSRAMRKKIFRTAYEAMIE
jgi:predicted RNase H-like nuclease (RuvC/YqgF family)